MDIEIQIEDRFFINDSNLVSFLDLPLSDFMQAW